MLASPHFGTLATYSSVPFGDAAADWLELAKLGDAAFGWPPIRFAHAHGVSGALISNRSLTERAASKLVEAVRDGNVREIALNNFPNSVTDDRLHHSVLVAGYDRLTRYGLLVPPNQLRFEVGAFSVIPPSWPAGGPLLALESILRLTRAEYACVHTGRDWNHAATEMRYVLHTPFPCPVPEPAYIGEFQRRINHRHCFGEKVRGAYWGNLFSEKIVAQIGGVAALRETGAAVVTTLDEGRVYVQLTESVGDAESPEGTARLARLADVLKPVELPFDR